MSTDHPAAVLWDMDGTLVDTDPYWMQAETELTAEHGGEWTSAQAKEVIGAGLWVTAGVLQSRGVDLTGDEIVHVLTDRVQRLIDERGVPWRPGALELLTETRRAGIPTALVTMSIRRMAEQIVSRIPFDAFDVLVTGDTVDNPKPNPEPYLRAVELLGVEPADTIAIEDSISGLASAVRAGTIALAVPHLLAIPDSSEYAVWESLAGRTVHDLAELRRIVRAADGDPLASRTA